MKDLTRTVLHEIVDTGLLNIFSFILKFFGKKTRECKATSTAKWQWKMNNSVRFEFSFAAGFEEANFGSSPR
jgi:hypothetical protein